MKEKWYERIKIKCKLCGKKFLVYNCRKNAIFCSRKCYFKQKIRNRIKKKCHTCGKIIFITVYRSKISKYFYCSLNCRGNSNRIYKHGKDNPRWSRKKKNCLNCNKQILIQKSTLKKGNGKFCSKKCYGIWIKKYKIYNGKNNPNWKGRFVKKCLFCKKKIRIFKHEKYKKRFCSSMCFSKFCSKYLSGKNHWKYKRYKRYCKWCSKKIYVISSRLKKGFSKFCSKSCFENWLGENKSGKNSYLWRGGISFEPYPVCFNRKLKKYVRKRFKFKCQLCKKYGIIVHHIDYVKKNCDLNNLITLCKRCHTKTNFNRKYWTKYFQRIMEKYEFNRRNKK